MASSDDSIRGRQAILPAMPHRSPDVSIPKDAVTWLYPSIEPYNTGRLQVSPLHNIYIEESGNLTGSPLSFCTAVRAAAAILNSAVFSIPKNTAL